VIGLLRRVRLLSPLHISAQQAIDIARAESDARGWPWQEPVVVDEGLRGYRIWTNAQMRGGNVSIHVDGHSGRVSSARLVAR
jgi:hypothetical protein